MPQKEKDCRAGVFRVAVDRLDEDAQMARVEIVPLAMTKSEFLRKVKENEQEELGWWDGDAAETRLMPSAELRERLGLQAGQALVENMVFWLVGDPKKPGSSYHATQAARALSKKLYERLTGQQTGSGPDRR